MKKLAIFIYSLNSGGAEKVVSTLLQPLSQKYDIFLVLMNSTIKYDVKKFTNIHLLENSKPTENVLMKLLKLPYLAYKYTKFCKTNKIDLSLSLLTRPNFIAILSKYFANPAKIIISEHSFLSQHYQIFTPQSLINKFLIKLLYPQVNTIISVSKGVKNDLIKNFNIKSSIHNIYNPLDLQDINVKKLESLEFNFNNFTFITIGRLDTGKNHELQIRALKRLNNSKINLVIIGEGVLKNSLKILIKQLSLENQVFLIGYVSNPYKYLNKASCFLFSSNHESFGIVLTEALSCSLPIISTDCLSGPREILAPLSKFPNKPLNTIECAEYGILTPLNNVDKLMQAMQTIINQPNLANQYRNKAKIRANDFKKDKIIAQYIKILQET